MSHNGYDHGPDKMDITSEARDRSSRGSIGGLVQSSVKAVN